jgi:hypothetical protein
MFWYLLHGNLVQAARHHLAALVGLLYGLYALIAWTLKASTELRISVWRPSTKAWVVYVGLFLVYAVILRNVPWQPFVWLDIPNLT